jgi:hypothetical protein
LTIEEDIVDILHLSVISLSTSAFAGVSATSIRLQIFFNLYEMKHFLAENHSDLLLFLFSLIKFLFNVLEIVIHYNHLFIMELI